MALGFPEFQRLLRQAHLDNFEDLEYISNRAKEANMGKTDDTDTLPMCVACRSTYEDLELVKLRCDHNWCNDCLENKFKLAMRDEEAYPPRCCFHIITLAEVVKRLSEPLVKEFKSRQLELKTKNKTYCHKPDCSAFIAPHSVHNGEAICQKCYARTCSKCRGQWHFGPCSAGKYLWV